MRIRLKRGGEVWDATGRSAQSGFSRVLLLDGAQNHHGLQPVRDEQTQRRGWVRLEDIVPVDGDGKHYG